MDDYGQVHGLVNGAIVLESAGCVEGSDAIGVVAGELLLDFGCTWLGTGPGVAIAVPGAILNDVHNGGIIDEGDALTFFDGDLALHELGFVHMDGIGCARCGGVTTGAGTTTCYH